LKAFLEILFVIFFLIIIDLYCSNRGEIMNYVETQFEAVKQG